MKAIYGNYGFWSWLRYWWLDTENYITLMLFDKSYYDYDFENVKEKPVLTEEDREIWSQDKLNAILGVKRKTATAEELQADVLSVKEDEKIN